MNFIFEKEGACRLAILARELRRKYLKRASIRYGNEITSYIPWLGLDASLEKGELGKLLFHNYKSPCLEMSPELLIELKALKTFKKNGKLLLDPLEEWDLIDHSDTYQLDHVNRMFTSAFELLTQKSIYFSDLFPSLIEIVIPLDGYLDFERGFSNQYVKGAIFLTPRIGEYTDYKIAISMAHELGHQALMLYQTADSIIVQGQKEISVYSGVRKTYRPAMQAFHAIAALSFMIHACNEFLNEEQDEKARKFIIQQREEYVSGINDSLFDLRNKCQLTEIGALLLNEMESKTCAPTKI